MARNLVCSECGGTMQIGYVPDFAYREIKQLFWVEGQLERTFWDRWGVRFKGKKRFYITAYRCERCGFLKFYAGLDNSDEK